MINQPVPGIGQFIYEREYTIDYRKAKLGRRMYREPGRTAQPVYFLQQRSTATRNIFVTDKNN